MLRVGLKYDPEGEPIVAGLERVSQPGRRVYAAADEIPEVLGGLGVSIVSTSKGIVTDKTARAVAPRRRSPLQRLVREEHTVSRIGKMPVVDPQGGRRRRRRRQVRVKGPKGELVSAIPAGLTVSVADGEVQIARGNDEPHARAFHGLLRSLVANNVEGVTKGFTQELEIVGRRLQGRGQGQVGRLLARLFAPGRLPDPRRDRDRDRREGRAR